MALSGRTAIRIGAVVAGLGFLAWNQFHGKQQAPAAAATATATARQRQRLRRSRPRSRHAGSWARSR